MHDRMLDMQFKALYRCLDFLSFTVSSSALNSRPVRGLNRGDPSI